MRDKECTEILSGDLGGCIILTTVYNNETIYDMKFNLRFSLIKFSRMWEEDDCI
jgi:hypothetical protein